MQAVAKTTLGFNMRKIIERKASGTEVEMGV